MPFEILPAIDLLGGRCVRLRQGRYDDVTVFDDDPGRVAASYAEAGSHWVHVVDLDGARDGKPGNASAVAAVLARAEGLSVELGGGIRDLASVDAWVGRGVARVVVGTAALRDPGLVREAARRHPGKVAVGIDARDGRVAVEGWTETSETTALDLARRFEDAGVAALIHTDIARDGVGTGPNLEATAEIAEAVTIPVIASGGVASLDHVRAAAALHARGVAGLIIGRALYDGDVVLGDALEAARCA